MTVKRYSMEAYDSDGDNDLFGVDVWSIEREDGKWVKYEDYLHLENKARLLESALENIKEDVMRIVAEFDIGFDGEDNYECRCF